MEQKSHGGKRRGAGRKSVVDKKQQVVLYVPGKDVLKFGSPDKLKDKLKNFIDEFGNEPKINFLPTTEASFDGKRVVPINDEPLSFDTIKSQINTPVRSFEYFRTAKKEIDVEEDWLKMKAEIEAAPNLTQKQKILLTTTNI